MQYEDRIDQFLSSQLEQSLAELSNLCRQPSVSAHNWGLEETAGLVARMLEKRGFAVRVFPTAGAPIVFAERGGRSPRTLLFYNHYDVQPAEPLELWESPPFEPSLRDGKLFGRGVSDDKGHFVNRLFAIDAVLAAYGELPCGIKFVVEGEEEVSSEHLEEFVHHHKDLLAADACIWEFGAVDSRDVPLQHLGLRGICYVELSVETANQDVHSGLGGSIFPNAAWRLIWALASLKNEQERILIDGFYDRVRPPSPRDLEYMAALPDNSQEYRDRYGISGFLNDMVGGVDLRVAEVFHPTCTICGLTSGYQGPGVKTVLPTKASAKIDFRLVPDQSPQEILQLLREHLDRRGFQDVHITDLGSEPAARTDPDHPFVTLVVESAQDVYGAPMQIIPMIGGSGPNYIFIDALKLPVVTLGFGYPGAQTHAPNENLRLDLYLKTARHTARVISAAERLPAG
jgi:acetylornithine deacetylase/succinyl-diaminopimelate desuccinylase-like protein